MTRRVAPNPAVSSLSRRERQIMDILYRLGHATAAEVQRDLPGEPSSSTVRTQLRVLERKGFVVHEEAGLRYLYEPTIPRQAARQIALDHLIDTFFAGSVDSVVSALLGASARRTVQASASAAAGTTKARKEGRRT